MELNVDRLKIREQELIALVEVALQADPNNSLAQELNAAIFDMGK